MKRTGSILDKIVAAKRDYLRAQKSLKPQESIERGLTRMSPYEGPGFYTVLKNVKPKPKIIAEVKKASPSVGLLREPFLLDEINEVYQAAYNVVAISVITESKYFQGSEDSLAFFAANNTHQKPLLRKDFIFDPYQILESKLLGAQAYLLIAALFDKSELDHLVDFGLSIGIEPLVEVHNKAELELAQATKARCIGVNARDLTTFSTDLKIHELLRELDDSYVRVAESGIENAQTLSQVAEYSEAALIGSHFMRAPNITDAINEMLLQPGAEEKR